MTDRSLSLPDLGRALRSRWRRMLVVGGSVLALAVLFIVLVPPRYRGEALLRVQASTPGEGLLGGLGGVAGAGMLGLSRDEVDTEMGVIDSRRMQDAAIDSLGLEVSMARPRGSRHGVVSVRSSGESTLEGELELQREGPGRWSLSASWSGDSASVPATVATGAPFAVGPLTVTVLPEVGPERITLELRPRYQVYELLANRLSVDRPSASAKLIQVRFEDHDRYLASRVVEVIVGAYLAFTHETERGDATRTIGGLRQTADSVAGALRVADEALRDYQSSARIIAPEEQASAQVKRVATLRGQLDQLEVEQDALRRLLAIVDQRASGGRDATAYRQLATYPALITNRAIQDLLGTLMTLENERSRLGVGRTEQDPAVLAVVGRIEEIERTLRRIVAEYLESLEQQMSELSGALGRMAQDISALPEAEMRYVQLARQRTLLGETWVLLQKQLRQAEVQETLRQDRVRLVDPPRVPQEDEAVFPNPPVHLLLGLILATLAALAAGLIGLRPPQHEAERDGAALGPLDPVEEVGATPGRGGPSWR